MKYKKSNLPMRVATLPHEIVDHRYHSMTAAELRLSFVPTVLQYHSQQVPFYGISAANALSVSLSPSAAVVTSRSNCSPLLYAVITNTSVRVYLVNSSPPN